MFLKSTDLRNKINHLSLFNAVDVDKRIQFDVDKRIQFDVDKRIPSSPTKRGWSSLATVSTEEISTRQRLLELPREDLTSLEKTQQFICRVESTPILELEITFSMSLDMHQHAVHD